MKKTLLAMGLGLFATAAMAQNFPVKMGFEDADKADWYHCQYRNYIGVDENTNKFGDWVNPNLDDTQWREQESEAAVNGEYGLFLSCVGKKNAWDRGFKLANLPIQNGKSYRMSFWVKGGEGKVLKAYLSKGVEQLDKSFVDPAGNACYGANGSDDYTLSGEWEHVSFVAYNHGAEVYNNVLANTSWMGGAVVGQCVPESLWEAAGITESNKDKTYRDFWNGTIPEIYFAIINMYDEGEYYVDDICIEEDKYFAQATYNQNIIKLDFGYATNIADLVKAGNGEYLKLDLSQFKVEKDGSEIEILSAEATADGYVYIFLDESQSAEGATVSFTPNEKCPLEYGANKRPSNSTDAMPIFGFENEATYLDTRIEKENHIVELPKLVSSSLENGSFDLKADAVQEFVLTYDAPVSVDASEAGLTDDEGNDVIAIGDMPIVAGDDENTIIVKNTASLKDGNYVLTVFGNNENYQGDETTLSFTVGKYIFDPDQATEPAFQSAFEGSNNNSVPAQGTMVPVKDASPLTPGEGRGSGPRLFTDFAAGGQFTAALYLRDWDDGYYYEIGTREDEVINLSAGKNKLSFIYANWKGDSQNLTVEVFPVDEEGNAGEPIESQVFTGVLNVNGGKAAVSGAPVGELVFNLDEEGRYGARFKGTGEYLIANISMISVPNMGGIESKSKLFAAWQAAEDFYYNYHPEANEGDEALARFAGPDFDNLKAVYEKYEDPEGWLEELNMTTPSQYNEAIEEINNALQAAQDYMTLVQTYDTYRSEDGKVADFLANNAEALVAQLDCYKQLNETYQNYKDQALTDKEEMKKATDILVNNYTIARRWNGETVTAAGADAGGNVGSLGLNALLYRTNVAIKTIMSMKPELTEEDEALIEMARNSVKDNDNIVNALQKLATKYYYQAIMKNDNKFFESEKDADDNVLTDGTYDFSFFLKNPNLYIQTNQDQIAQSLEATNIGTEEEPVNIYAGAACPGWTFTDLSGWSTWSTGWTDFKSADVPVEAMASNWGGTYTIKQTIENLPAGLYDLQASVNERDAFHEDSYFFVTTTGTGEAELDSIVMAAPNLGQSWASEPNLKTSRRNGMWIEGKEITEDILDGDGNVTTEAPEEIAPDAPVEILDGKLTIGAHAGASDSHIFINRFKVVLMGASSKFNYDDNDFWTGVDEVKSNKVINVAVYDMNGRRLNHATKGVNLVKRTYSDGSVKVSKYLVK